MFVTTATEEGQSYRLVCLDRKSGAILWNNEIVRQTVVAGHANNTYATATPVTDGSTVFVLAADGTIAAVSFEGKVLWKYQEFEYFSEHGLGMSPILYGDLLIVALDHTNPGANNKPGLYDHEPESIELAKVGDRSLDLITEAELQRLLHAADGPQEKDLRDKALLHLLFSTGLRVSELCSLNADIDLTRDEFSIRGKGGKVRVVFLSPEAKQALHAYLKARTDMDEALFVTIGKRRSDSGDSRLTPRSVQRLIKYYAVKAGITRKVTPHIIRHAFATDLLGNGADLRSVQALLGHANIATTQVYTHVTDAHLKEVHKRFHGKK